MRERLRRFRSLSVAAALTVLVCAPGAHGASILLLDTQNDSQALIEISNSQFAFDRNTLINLPSNSNVFHGDAMSASQARTAGRSSSGEIAANARFDNRSFRSVTDYTEVRGTAIQRLQAQLISGGPAEVFIDFVLPPGFVEFSSNAELPPGMVTLQARILAALGVCRNVGCLIPDDYFHVDTQLSGDYYSHELYNTASGDGLDLSSLLHSNVDVVSDGFISTKTWSYPEFHGRLSLGVFYPDETFEVVYFMDSIIGLTGFGPLTYAAAAINDPFFLSTDSVRPVDVRISAIDLPNQVPEPPTVWLAVASLLLFAACRKKSVRV